MRRTADLRELANAIQAGVYPRLRTWIDFKRRLYPEATMQLTGRQGKSQSELARDMASMAEAGWVLVYA